MEKKLYEKKRMVSAEMNEVLGGMTRAEIEAKKKAGYRKAADVLQDPRDIKIKISSIGRKKSTKKKKELEEDLARAVKMGIKRSKTRLGYAAGHLLGKGIVGAANIAGKAGETAEKAKRAIADPIPAAAGAAKAAGETVKKAYKSTRTQGTKTNTALRYIAGALKSV